MNRLIRLARIVTVISLVVMGVSSIKAKAALKVLSSSPSANTIFLDEVFAASKTGFIKIVDL